MRASRFLFVLVAVIAVLACVPAAAQVVTSTVGVQVNPASAAVDTTRNKIYVANNCGNDPTCQSGNGSVTVINGTTLATQTVQVGDYPYSVAVDTGLNQIYVATCASDPTCGSLGAVTVINGGTLATTNITTTGHDTDWVVVNPVTHNVYAVNECNDNFGCLTTYGTVTVINGSNLNAPPQNVSVGAWAWSAVVNTQTNTVYVMNRCGNSYICGQDTGTVTVINGNTLATQTIAVGFYPQFAAVDEVHNKVYVANNGGADGSGNPGTLSVIDGATNTVQTTINVGIDPSPVVWNPNLNKIYVGNQCGSDPNCVQPPTVTVIDYNTLTVTATVPICKTQTQPADDSEVDLSTNMVYFACRARPNQTTTTGLSLTVLDGATNSTTPVAVGDYPNAAVVNSATNQIYVPNFDDGTVSVIGGNTKLQLVNVTPCRVVDTRQANGPFGGPSIQGGTFRSFAIPQGACHIPASAVVYSLNATVVPHGTLGFLTIWPTPEMQPTVSTLNSTDGRVKANATTVPAGVGGAVSVYASNTTDVLLDIDGYFAPATSSNYQFYPLPPCRIVDTRGGHDGGTLQAGVERDYSIPGNCGIPSSAAAYSFNVTVLPAAGGLDYLTVWPKGESMPNVSTLNDNTGTVVANAAIVPAGSESATAFYAHSNNTDLLLDVDGYFAAPGSGGLSMYPQAPCRVLDTRQNNGSPFMGEKTVNVVGSACAPPSNAQAYVFNATVVPSGSMPYLTLWPDGEGQPNVSTLNAYDGFITSNMAIVLTNDGSIDAYAYALTQLILDISGYFAP